MHREQFRKNCLFPTTVQDELLRKFAPCGGCVFSEKCAGKVTPMEVKKQEVIRTPKHFLLENQIAGWYSTQGELLPITQKISFDSNSDMYNLVLYFVVDDQINRHSTQIATEIVMLKDFNVQYITKHMVTQIDTNGDVFIKMLKRQRKLTLYSPSLRMIINVEKPHATGKEYFFSWLNFHHVYAQSGEGGFQDVEAVLNRFLSHQEK